MPITPTPRLGLQKQAGGDSVAIKPLNDSFDLLDKYVGTYVYTGPLVAPSQIPDGIPLYNGLVVVEDATGISYQVIKGASGVWRKQFIQYPWYIATIGDVNQGVPSDSTYRTIKIETFVEGKNATSAALDGARITLPVSGVYICNAKVQWPACPGGARAVRMEDDPDQGDMQYGDSGHSTVTNASTIFRQGGGEKIGIQVWQDSGAILTPNLVRVRVALITRTRERSDLWRAPGRLMNSTAQATWIQG